MFLYKIKKVFLNTIKQVLYVVCGIIVIIYLGKEDPNKT